MQPRYTLQQPLQKKDYLEYGRLLTHISTRWAWCVLAILPLVFLALYVAALFDGENRPEFLLFGVACFAYWAFSGEIFGSSAFSGAVRTTGLPRGYAFYEDYVQAFTTTGDTKVAYSAVKKLAETDQIFLLSISRNNYLLIPKSALAPHDITPFRAFLEEKTGKASKHVRVRAKTRYLLFGCLTATALIAFVLGQFVFRSAEPDTKVFSRDTYSITLPKGFSGLEGDDESGIFYQITNLDTYITVSFRTDTALMRAGFNPAFGAKNYITRLLDQISIHPEDLTERDDGAACATYTDTYEDGEFFYYLVCQHENEAFWCTEFYCSAADRSKYEPLFAEWAASIRITPQADN